ncbi:MAG: Biopolymer transport protein ExbD/TolR [Ramlibacter sp.]|jgi:biopolymer transport protein TolR|uniref:ExbD/TolR family protein n=1 Tax=Ramlibacter sp. TaxID=1917967 RepID=UPI00263735B7|nr:biopolymer transporter ExbD [Ramlibacter sp.]MDB5749870.1 Biopolymer transport protein ExbD/TolR [Ramlibacter sp.]
MAFGRLERTHGPQPISDINVTPLVDVMLVLVVILIITAPLLASSIRLDLPRADGTQAGEAPRFVSVTLDKAGRAFLNDKPVSGTELAQELAAAARLNADTEIQLRADQGVPYGRVVEVMGAAHKAGLGRIGFVAEPAKP